MIRRAHWGIRARNAKTRARLLALVFVLCGAFFGQLFVPVPRVWSAEAQIELAPHAKSAVLMEASTGAILYAKNPDKQLPPASVTKVMTLTLALEAVRDGRIKMDDIVTTSEHAHSMGGSQIWLETGEQMTVKEMLYAIAVGSANDAAVAMAEHLAGSEAAFAQLMNERAKELGMRNTHFSNASGLPPRSLGSTEPHVTTAYDLAVLSRYALTLPHFTEMVSTWEYTMRAETSGEPVLYNYNRLLRQYPGMDGIKTGMTSEAGFCLSATAERGGLRMIAVVLGEPGLTQRNADITALLNAGFQNYEAKQIVEAGESFGEIAVRRGSVPKVEVVAANDLRVALPRGDDGELERVVEWSDSPVAPLDQGSVVGRLSVKRDGKTVGEVELVTAAEVLRGSLLQQFRQMGRRLAETLLP